MPTDPGSPLTKPATTGGWTGIWQTDLNNFVKAANAKGYTQLATQFKAFALKEHAINPTWTVQQLLSAFIAKDTTGALQKVIPQVTTDLGAIPQAAAKGAEQAIEALGGFNLANWFLRVGEILLGLVLIGVGVARITGAQNAISKVVKTKVPIPL